MKKLGEILRDARHASGLPLKEISARVFIDSSTICHQEVGTASITIKDLEKLTKLYGIPCTPEMRNQSREVRQGFASALAKEINGLLERGGHPPEQKLRLYMIKLSKAQILNPSMEMLERISGYYGVPLETLTRHLSAPEGEIYEGDMERSILLYRRYLTLSKNPLFPYFLDIVQAALEDREDPPTRREIALHASGLSFEALSSDVERGEFIEALISMVGLSLSKLKAYREGGLNEE